MSELLGMCKMDFSNSVRFRFGLEKPLVWFGFLCRSVVKYKKSVSCLSCVCILHFGRWFSKCSIGLKYMFLKFNLNFNLNHIVFVYMMPIMSLSCVCNVKNVKALWEWFKYQILTICMRQVRFWEKPRIGNRNFGFDLLASVRFGFLKPKPNRNSVSAHP